MKYLAALLLFAALSAAAAPPNVVILFCDDAGYGDFSCYGAKDIATPHIDQLAKDGLRFTSFYVAQAVCSASRTALLTGCLPNRIGILGALGPRSQTGIGAGETTLGELLKSRGYTTGIFGKWHLGDQRPFLPLQNGFDEYLGLPYSNNMWPLHPEMGARPGHISRFPPLNWIDGNEPAEPVASLTDQTTLTTRCTERAVKFIEKNKNGPFFLYVPFSMPHVPLGVSSKHSGKSQRGMYGDVIQEIDWAVGEVLAALEKAGVASNTFVLFSSDNGPWLRYGNHAGSAGPLREGKGTMFEGGCRVPGIVRWPGHVKPGRTTDAIAATVDVLPTLAAITGAALPAHPIDGKSFLPLLEDENVKPPRDSYIYYYGRDLIAFRQGPWKLFFPHTCSQYNEGTPAGNDGTPARAVQRKFETMLCNLDTDIGERNDVKAQHADIVDKLTELAKAYDAELKANSRPVGRVEATKTN